MVFLSFRFRTPLRPPEAFRVSAIAEPPARVISTATAAFFSHEDSIKQMTSG